MSLLLCERLPKLSKRTAKCVYRNGNLANAPRRDTLQHMIYYIKTSIQFNGDWLEGQSTRPIAVMDFGDYCFYLNCRFLIPRSQACPSDSNASQ